MNSIEEDLQLIAVKGKQQMVGEGNNWESAELTEAILS